MIYNKYRPTNLNDIHHNKSTVDALLQIKRNDNNYIIYGLDGTGKTTILMAYINSLFDYDNLIYEKKNTNIDLPINNSITSVNINSSCYHFEINCEDFNDKRIVNHFIKMLSNTCNIINNKKKIIIVKHLELLNIEYQWMLRRTIENVYNTCRIFFISNNISKIDNSITSRCICFRTELLNKTELYNIICSILEQEKIVISETQTNKIINTSNRNLSTCLVMLEYTVHSKKFTKPVNYYDQLIDNFIIDMSKATQLTDIIHLRDTLHLFILYEINFKPFFTKIFDYFVNSDIDNDKKIMILNVIANNNHTVHLASKKLYHLECLVTNIILINNTEELNTIDNIINFY